MSVMALFCMLMPPTALLTGMGGHREARGEFSELLDESKVSRKVRSHIRQSVRVSIHSCPTILRDAEW